MSSNPSNYSKSDEMTNIREERVSKLRHELRDHYRSLSNHTFLSQEWLKMVDTIYQVAGV